MSKIECRVDILIKILEWTIFLGLCISSYFVTSEVGEKYLSYDSNFKRSMEPVTDGPTMVFCFFPGKNKDNDKVFQFGIDFTLSYFIWGKGNKTLLEKGENLVNFTTAIRLQVRYEEMYYRSAQTCHKGPNHLLH